MAKSTQVSLADFMKTPNLYDSRLELVDGEASYKQGRSFALSRVVVCIGTLLDGYGEAGIGARAILESHASSLLLDVAYFREGPPDDSDYIRTPPHVVVEVLGVEHPLDRARRRAALFVEFGVESTWIVDPERETLTIIEAGVERQLARGQRLTTPAVPGLDIDVSELFPARRRQSAGG